MAPPSEKYSNSANKITSAKATATHAVEPHNTMPTTTGINTAAVATRFQVMNGGSSRLHGRLTVEEQKLKGKVSGGMRGFAAAFQINTRSAATGRQRRCYCPATLAGTWESGPPSRIPP